MPELGIHPPTLTPNTAAIRVRRTKPGLDFGAKRPEELKKI
jgi:hypothetical protein